MRTRTRGVSGNAVRAARAWAHTAGLCTEAVVTKPATVKTLEPFYVTGSVGRIDRQFAVNSLADIG